MIDRGNKPEIARAGPFLFTLGEGREKLCTRTL